MDYLRDSFSVHSPGSESYRNSWDKIFKCSQTGELKSKCECESCAQLRNIENTSTDAESK